jgi:hypothetical protein
VATILRQQPTEQLPQPSNAFFYFNPQGYTIQQISKLDDIKFYGGGISYASGYTIRMKKLPVVRVSWIEVHDKANTGVGLDNVTKGLVAQSKFWNIINVASHGSGGYGVYVGGDASFDSPWPPLGTENAVFIENCYFNACKHAVAGERDGKYVFRYNRCENGWSAHAQVDAHGAQNAGPAGNSTNTFEVYENDIYLAGNPAEGGHSYGAVPRGGSGVIYNNRIHSGGGSSPSDAIIITDMDIKSSNQEQPGKYVYPRDYPILWQPRNIYAWGNTYDGNPVEITEDDSEQWFVEDRSAPDGFYDYRNMAKPGYAPYEYPHPLNIR